MPVLKIYFSRLERMTGLSQKRILDRLPFLGLDLESSDEESVRIEYNPNRADFSTDYGIARALRGLVGSETGLPEYQVAHGPIVVKADPNLAKVRPWIACAVARGLKMDDETIRQLISMQEDLHNGIGRRRKKAAIGLHNLDAVKPPLHYRGMPGAYGFTPLGSSRKLTIAEILRDTDTGVTYGSILKGASAYPVLYDSKGMVLSFPPITNGRETKVDTGTRNLLVDVTSTDEWIGGDVLAIICSALSDAGGKIESVRVDYQDASRVTPDLDPTAMMFDRELARKITGLDLSASEMEECLARSRLGLKRDGSALIPRYRADIIHPVDLAEEVAIGYGLDRIVPLYPASSEPGRLSRENAMLDSVSESVAMAGFIETVSYDLTDAGTLYERFARDSSSRIEVENPRTLEHHILRDSILPSLMAVLSKNAKAEYPQRVFEVGRVYSREGSGITESPHLAAAVAHSSSSFSEAKMYLEAVVREHIGAGLVTKPAKHWAFADGRCASVSVDRGVVGHIGELRPSAVAAFGLDVPVSGFEIDLAAFL